jgi:hypothetical protein
MNNNNKTAVAVVETAVAVVEETAVANSSVGNFGYLDSTYVVVEVGEEVLLPTPRKEYIHSTATAVSTQIPQPRRGPKFDYQKIVLHYFTLVSTEVKLNWRNPFQEKINLYHLRRQRIKRKLGQYSVNNQRLYWLDWFEASDYSLYTIQVMGNNLTKENTIVTLNYDFATEQELTTWPRTAIEEYYSKEVKDIEDYFETPIDIDSLALFIERGQQVETRGRWDTRTKSYKWASDEYKLRVKENLKQAVCILKLQENNKLKQAYRYSEFGRLYFMGLNLQNCKKELRHAALGHCYSIDISVCSQAWKVYLCETINPNIKMNYTKSLIKDKNKFRQDVAKLLRDKDTARSKQIITAIGFGADIEAKPWPTGNDNYKLPAIREIINKEEVELLTNSHWFMEFIEEQRTMNKLIMSRFLIDNPKDTIPSMLKSKAGSIQSNKVMAYLYQKAEYDYLAAIMAYIINRFGQEELLLPVHDAVYIKHSINKAELVSALHELNPYLNVEITEHYGHFKPESKPELNTDVEIFKHALATGNTQLLQELTLDLHPGRYSVANL